MGPASGVLGRVQTAALTAFRWLPGPLRRTLVRAGTPSFTVGAVCGIVHDDAYLVLRQPHRPGWSLPGGLLDRGESAAEGVQREVREETGLHIEVGLPWSVKVEGTLRRVDVVYRIAVDERPAVAIGGEARRADWLPVADVVRDADAPTRDVMDLLTRAGRAGATDGRIVGGP